MNDKICTYCGQAGHRASQCTRRELTAERLREVLFYDAPTQQLVWRSRNARGARSDLVGKPAGSPHKDGYTAITVDGKKYLAHRLVWLYLHGTWPVEEIDHRNRSRKDNSAANLRDVSRSLNQQNRGGVIGADFHKAAQRWRARIAVAGRSTFLGYFETRDAAAKAYLDAKKEYHPNA